MDENKRFRVIKKNICEEHYVPRFGITEYGPDGPTENGFVTEIPSLFLSRTSLFENISINTTLQLIKLK